MSRHLSILAFFLLSVPGPAQDQPDRGDKDIVATAVAAGSFKVLVTAVQAAGLESKLRGEGPFTVLAPQDAAFAALPEGTLDALLKPANREALVRVLQGHVIAGRVDAAAALGAGSALTLAGVRVTVGLDGGRLQLGDANVIANDVGASNGLIHIIDRVLVPADLQLRVPSPSLQLITIAVQRGVPLFNDGNQTACAAIYRVAAAGLLLGDELSKPAREQIRTAIDAADAQPAILGAWTLRRALDVAADELLAADGAPREARRLDATIAQPTVDPAGQEPRAKNEIATLFSFDEAAELRSWRLVNDTVMGGRSSSDVAYAAPGTAVFSGDLSLENNGGFTSLRAPIEDGVLAAADGLSFRVRGDGRTYRLLVSTRANGLGGDGYDCDFKTVADEWQTVRIAFADMRRNVMGRRPTSPPPSAADVRSIGFLLGDKNPGPFRVELDWIRAYQLR